MGGTPISPISLLTKTGFHALNRRSLLSEFGLWVSDSSPPDIFCSFSTTGSGSGILNNFPCVLSGSRSFSKKNIFLALDKLVATHSLRNKILFVLIIRIRSTFSCRFWIRLKSTGTASLPYLIFGDCFYIFFISITTLVSVPFYVGLPTSYFPVF